MNTVLPNGWMVEHTGNSGLCKETPVCTQSNFNYTKTASFYYWVNDNDVDHWSTVAIFRLKPKS